jgi:hypothetical protein
MVRVCGLKSKVAIIVSEAEADPPISTDYTDYG